MTGTYDELEPTDPDWTRWTAAHVLRWQSGECGDQTFLIAPEEGLSLTFAETLERSERVAGGLRSAGVASGDRVVIMGRNSSSFVLSWFATALGDLVEAPVNTAYEGELLRHQVELVQARWVVVDSDLADRFVAINNRLPLVEGSGSSIRAARTRLWPDCARPDGGRIPGSRWPVPSAGRGRNRMPVR